MKNSGAYYFRNISFVIAAIFALVSGTIYAQSKTGYTVSSDLYQSFQQPPESAKPWVFWYWMQAAVSKEGITADLEAMKQAGIGGAYLMPIKGAADPPLINPPVEQLTPEWWSMVKFAMSEADRLGIKLAMHDCDGFATAGGPWIKPEQSMQKVVWSQTMIEGGRLFNDTIVQPHNNEGYYKDIAILAFPAPEIPYFSSFAITPKVTTSKAGINAQFLSIRENKEYFKSSDPCWIQYTFKEPFTCRSITIRTDGRNYFANRLTIEISDDGEYFRKYIQLEAPRQGWQDNDADVTHAVPAVTARYFRFVYNKEGAEPGAEDLDAAKWKPSLSLRGIELSSEPRIHQYEGKNGEVWRVGPRTTNQQVPSSACLPLKKILNITKYYNADGKLTWNAPPGKWIIFRVGHTSTGHTNYIGGKGIGLECDKFDPAVVKLQFDNWFGAAFREAGPELAKKVLKIFHVDSWECGSQNWSSVFQKEFQKRRGYDLLSYLPAMAGIPVESADISEKFLHDVRQTISELIVDNFYGTLKKLAHEKGCSFSAESVAPTMTSDGMLHYKEVDLPMGEFWLRSPTHDKPNDVLDAISGAHVYGKPVVQSEAFTELHFAWDEYPGMLKTIGDRNFALGINRLVYHVFVHNPWVNEKPGMTLGITGLYFQRDQTWWKPGRGWIDYIQRCQTLLQQGRPVADIAVFTGEDLPRRSILPEKLVSVLPGIFGDSVVKRESKRLANKGNPIQEMPAGVLSSANISKPENWIDPLHGYAYDSYNRDALLNFTEFKNGKLHLNGGAAYRLLVLPGSYALSPDGNLMSPEVAKKLLQLVRDGATVLINERPDHMPGLKDGNDQIVQQVSKELYNGTASEIKDGDEKISIWKVGKGRVIKGPYNAQSFRIIGMEQDVIANNTNQQRVEGIAWTHRTAPGLDIYFISNQQDQQKDVVLSLRVSGRIPELWDPLTGDTCMASSWKIEKGRTILPLRLAADGSIFIVFKKPTTQIKSNKRKNWVEPETVQTISGPWEVKFDTAFKGPLRAVSMDHLEDWRNNSDSSIIYYSGTAAYANTFQWNSAIDHAHKIWLDLGKVYNIAEVKVNGISCGIAWTSPFRVDISKALKSGKNDITVEVTNTWNNRLVRDHNLPENQQFTHTTANYVLKNNALLPAGLLGPVTIAVSKKN
ncbi:MAG TPA: glycosyl hydrolase [Flavisolibacter sp.]|nr:glycosyl hydrolase [Flavisolibacter sp.]